ncbi:MAG: metal-dependent hydrolase [Chloroflexota bacterium]
MLPPAHIAYTWLGVTVAQKKLGMLQDVDYRWMALAAMGPDLIDKPLAWAYFYKRFKSAVLFAHTLLAFLLVAWLGFVRFPTWAPYALAYLGHGVCDRIWSFTNTFYWPFRGWRFHVWGKQGSEQEEISRAYWIAFTRRPELWAWEVGGLLAMICVIWWHKLYIPKRMVYFILKGKPPS